MRWAGSKPAPLLYPISFLEEFTLAMLGGFMAMILLVALIAHSKASFFIFSVR
jgi:hypothetical protein